MMANTKFSAPRFLQNRELLYLSLVILLSSFLLTWLYLRAAEVSPQVHYAYTKALRDLREADVQTDSEVLANRLEITRNYDRLSFFIGEVQQAASGAAIVPSFMPIDDLNRIVEKARELQQVLEKKAQLVDSFKRTNAILRNSLAYFPATADELLATENMPRKTESSVENYTRQVLSFARSPAPERRTQVDLARQKLIDSNSSFERKKIDNLVLHGDAIIRYLPEVNDLPHKIMGFNIAGQLEELNRVYAQGYGHAERIAGQFRKLLYSVALFLTVYLAFTFIRLERARSSLAKAHEEVSRHYAAQLVAEEQLRLHATAFHNAHDGIILADAEGNILDVNPAFTRITGYDRTESIGRNPRIIKSGRHDAKFYADMWKSIHDHGNWQGEIWNRNKHGVVYPELLSISEVRNTQGERTNFVGVFADITLLKEHDRLLQEAVQLSEDAILLIDCSTNKFIECNAATVRILHAAKKEEVLFAHPWDLSPEYQPDGRLSKEKSVEMNALAEKNKFHRFEWMFLRLDGELFPVEVTLTPVQLAEKKILHVMWRDLTEIKHAEQSLKRHTRALLMLTAGNQALVRSTDEFQLLETMCRVAVEVGGYRMAWVGYCVDDEGKTVQPTAHAGCEGGCLEALTISWGDSEYGRGPTGLAIRTGQTQIAKDIQTDPRFSPWRETAIKCGYSACIGLPLMIEGKAIGALMVYAGYADAFDEAELPLLEEMAEDLSYGVMALRNNIVRRQSEEQRDKSYSLLQAALEATADGLLVTALSGEIESFNLRFADMFGIPADILDHRVGCKIVEFIAHRTSKPSEFLENIRIIDQVPEATYRDIFALKDGRSIERITQPQYLNGLIVGRVCSYRDITEQKRHEQQLTYLANHDALTGLPNRNLLNDRLEQAIAQACRTGSLVAVLFFDMDRFKLINDNLGHDNGDLFLSQLAERLPYCIREGDTVARMGGDEFVILLPNLAHEEDAALVAHKLLDVIAAPYTLAGREVFSMASIGITLYPRDGDDAVTLLKHADAAMYRAKGRGGNCFQFFTGEINDQVARQFDIASKLRHALERNELQVYYQPQIDVPTGRVTGAEALLRWLHPEMGMVSPAEFIPIAEETGLILDIGAWVMETVCSHQKAWQSAGLLNICVAINLSARQFDLVDLPETFAKLLDETGVATCFLEIEITEGMVMNYPDRAVRMLNELKNMGFSISIDDFGTGYSSLGYLKRFPIDKLKIDRSFVQDIPDDKDDAAITRAVIAMAHELRLKVVAEGVETDEQFAFLREHGCDIVQGYLTGRPMPEEAFSALLKTLS